MPNDSLDYYEVLGIPFNATQEQIKNAYRKLAEEYQPDLNPNNIENATGKMQEVNKAYETLSNLEKRKQYDEKRQYDVSSNETAYSSYTESREDNERDLEECLKEYLTRTRRIDKIYNLYRDLKTPIRNYFGFENEMSSNNEEGILEALRDEFNGLIEFGENYPILVLDYLFEELAEAIGDKCFDHNYDYNFKAQIKLTFIGKYLPSTLDKYINKDGVYEYLSKKYNDSYYRAPEYKKSVEQIIEASGIAKHLNGKPRS